MDRHDGVCCDLPEHREPHFHGAAEFPEVPCMPTGFANSSFPPTQPLALHLVEEISHRVVNEYGEAIAMLSLAASRGEATAAPTLALAAERLRAMAEAHRSLLVPVVEDVIDLGRHVGTLCSSLSRATLGERGIRLTVTTDEIPLDAARCWRVGLIVSELVRNAVRHGLRGRQGSIHVALNQNGGRVWCAVCDDGCAASDPPEGRGRRLIRALTTELGGSVEWKFTQLGSIAGVQFPLRPSELPLQDPVGELI
jgi:two-component sensor histidine kinase